MGRSPFQRFIGFFLLLLCFKAGFGSSLMVGDAKVGCTERERHALLHFKQGVVDDFGMLSSWVNGEDKRDCCKWRGVQCNNQTGHVISLDLHAPYDPIDIYPYLSGKIDPSLAELQQLKHLNLSWNDFEGILPNQLGNLSNLQSLDLGSNYIECENLEWLSHLPLLTYLDLSDVNLSKAIHWPQAINKMPSLTELYLSDTQLPPIIPTISISHINYSTSLALLDLSYNGLTSSIYPWLFNFSSSLVHLDLSRNQLEGILPTQLGNVSNLQSLDLSWNSNMSCGNLEWLSNLPLLTHLDLSGVNLSKAIHWPQAINKMPSLTHLYLKGTPLPPIIPTISISHINSSTSLALLDLSFNNLTSSIYPWLFNFSTSLVHLDLSENQLHGSIPDAIGNMTTLTYLDLSSNQLEGILPTQLGNLSNLQSLHLPYNRLNGSIPDAVGNMTTLTYLDLSYNQLHGSIPDAVGNMTTLTYLDLSCNQLHGSIPDAGAVGNMTTLTYLDLSNNQLHGSIPDAVGNMTTLTYLDLSNNQLHGSIPDAVGNMTTPTCLYLSSNQLEELQLGCISRISR